MLNTQLHNDAERFLKALANSLEMKSYLKAKIEFQGNPELGEVRKRFSEKQTEIRIKQTAGTLTQEDIESVRSLQNKLNSHPITIRYTQNRNAMVNQLHDCNQAISQVLGFDFAAAAAPPSCCG